MNTNRIPGIIRKTLTFFLVLIFTFPAIFAQQRQITGKVTSADDGSILPGVNVIIKGTTRGVITGLDGMYSIPVNPGDDTLLFSYIGFQDKTVAIDDKTEINVVLSVEAEALNEVVVIGYGKVRKSDLSGSVSTVKSGDITKITSQNPVQSLSGKVAGIHVANTSGAPGSSPEVRIRGVGTFNNSSPIYVVDGVILNDISFLNSEDIASVEVLKDASATAIYGSRGANGVILITTKSGEAGAKGTQFSFDAEYGMQQVEKRIDLLTGRQFAIISNEIRPGSYNNVDLVPNTDWQDLIFHIAPQQNYQFSVSGATDNDQYYVGIGYYGQEGIIDKSSYQRLSLRFNNTYHLTDNISFGNNITIVPHKQQNAPNVTYAAYRAQPLLVPYYDDGSYAVVFNVGNPLASLNYSNDHSNGARGVGNIFAEATVFKDFTLKSSFGMDAKLDRPVNFTPAYTVYNPDGTSSQQQNVLSDLTKKVEQSVSWLWENTVTYQKDFEKHSINAVAGYTMQRFTSENITLPGENLIRDQSQFWYIQPQNIYDPSNNVNKIQDIEDKVDNNQYYSMISYLFRANYTYDRRYVLTFTFRRDGSSKFAAGNRYGNFPSGAVAWNISREAFMENMNFLSNLKLRASYGLIGNEKIAYTDRYARVDPSLLAIFGVNEAALPASTFGQTGNPDLKWETTKQADAGLEIGVLDNKITGEFDYYNRKTEDILLQLLIPGTLGNGQGQKKAFNAASVLNTGLEYRVDYRGNAGKLSYSIGFLGSTVHNEVLAIGGSSGSDSVLLGGALGNGKQVTESRVGLPIGAFFGYKTNGIFQSQDELDAYPHTSNAGVGDLRFVDVNNDNKIDDKDRTYIGSPIPDFIFGLNLSATYMGFDLSLDFQGQTGNKIFNAKEMVRPDPYNFEAHVFNRWTGPGTSNTEPRPSFGGYNYEPSDRFVQDGSFFRFRTMILGYTLPGSLLDKLSMNNLRIYLKGTNLYTLTQYTGYTPEIASGTVINNQIDEGTYPPTRVYSIGLNISF